MSLLVHDREHLPRGTSDMQLFRYRKTGNKKPATCLATLLQNELSSDVVHFTTHINQTNQVVNRFGRGW